MKLSLRRFFGGDNNKVCSNTGYHDARNFLKIVEKYLGKNVLDFAVINKTKPALMRFRPYVAEKSEFVEADLNNFGKKPVPITANLLRRGGLIRHDSEKLAKVVRMLI